MNKVREQQSPEKSWTIRSVVEWTAEFFEERGVEAPRLDAELLLAHVLACSRVDLYCHFDDPLDATHLADYRRLVAERGRRKPVAYLLGSREFMSLNFRVTPDVLIPRPETETLVEAALDRLEGQDCRVLDVGTGCGAIAVSLAFHHRGLRAAATDISAKVLAVAEENARQFGVERRIEFHRADLFDGLPEGVFDAVVSNPPYVSPADRDRMAPEVTQYEPPEALFCAAGAEGVYGALARGAAERLVPGGWLLTEVGYDSYDAARRAIDAAGAFDPEPGLRDLSGILRVAVARKKTNG